MFRTVFGLGCTAACLALALPADFEGQALHEPDGACVQVNGKRLWYRVEGQGAPLVLIPGGPGCQSPS